MYRKITRNFFQRRVLLLFCFALSIHVFAQIDTTNIGYGSNTTQRLKKVEDTIIYLQGEKDALEKKLTVLEVRHEKLKDEQVNQAEKDLVEIKTEIKNIHRLIEGQQGLYQVINQLHNEQKNATLERQSMLDRIKAKLDEIDSETRYFFSAVTAILTILFGVYAVNYRRRNDPSKEYDEKLSGMYAAKSYVKELERKFAEIESRFSAFNHELTRYGIVKDETVPEHERVLFGAAESFYGSGKVDTAGDILGLLVQGDKITSTGKARARVEYSMILIRDNKIEEAVEYLDLIISEFKGAEDEHIQLEVARAYINQADCLSKLERYLHAVEVVRKAINMLQSNDSMVYQIMSSRAKSKEVEILYGSGRDKEGNAKYSKFIALYSDKTNEYICETVTQLMLLNCNKLFGLCSFDGALKVAQQLIGKYLNYNRYKVKTNVAEAYYLSTLSLMRQGKSDEAFSLNKVAINNFESFHYRDYLKILANFKYQSLVLELYLNKESFNESYAEFVRGERGEKSAFIAAIRFIEMCKGRAALKDVVEECGKVDDFSDFYPFEEIYGYIPREIFDTREKCAVLRYFDVHNDFGILLEELTDITLNE